MAADSSERAWNDSAELSFIDVSGNAETTSLSLSNKYSRQWGISTLIIDAAALKAQTVTRKLDDPAGVKYTKAVTAESYSLAGKYRRTIGEKLFWYGTSGWLRNQLSGIENRYTLGAGVGYQFIKTKQMSFVGEFGIDGTNENQVGNIKKSFGGVRGFLGYERLLSPTSKFNSELELLENLKDTDDLRAKFVNSVTATLTSKLAMKAGYTLLYDQQPTILTIAGTPPKEFELDKVDATLGLSLVVNF